MGTSREPCPPILVPLRCRDNELWPETAGGIFVTVYGILCGISRWPFRALVKSIKALLRHNEAYQCSKTAQKETPKYKAYENIQSHEHCYKSYDIPL